MMLYCVPSYIQVIYVSMVNIYIYPHQKENYDNTLCNKIRSEHHWFCP